MSRTMKIITAVLAFSALSLLTLCGNIKSGASRKESGGNDIAADIIFDDEPEDEDCSLNELIKSMSLREKVGQLYIIRPDSLDFSISQTIIDAPDAPGAKALSEEMASVYHEYPAGGIIMFGKNIDNPGQLGDFISELQDESRIPLFIAVDEEGGAVSRIASNPNFEVETFESAWDVGKSADPGAAFNMGNTIGAYLSEYGFNMDFAPVADVNTNPDNPVIGKRAFSSEPRTAAEMSRSMAEALKENNIIPVYKHFPGHGDTSEDSHSGLALSYKTEEELYECELIPFMEAGSRDCVMIGHIAFPNADSKLRPASMSEYIIQDILKTGLGFDGLVISDSLAMKAVSDVYSPAEAALCALSSGCDMVLMPRDYPASFESVLAAVEDGTFSEELLNEKVFKILKFKRDYNLF